jgi:hypothetical protein
MREFKNIVLSLVVLLNLMGCSTENEGLLKSNYEQAVEFYKAKDYKSAVAILDETLPLDHEMSYLLARSY